MFIISYYNVPRPDPTCYTRSCTAPLESRRRAKSEKKPPVPFVYRTDYSIKTSENTSTPAREADKNTR